MYNLYVVLLYIYILFVTIQQLDEDHSNKSKTIGFSEENKPLNRFRNITVCKSLIVPIKTYIT